MTYSTGDNTQIIVGAAALFTYEDGPLADTNLPDPVADVSYKDTLTDSASFRNVGYTMNGLEIVFQPDFGEVQVDQFLDVAKLYKQGMTVNLNTTFAEATLENLLFALASADANYDADGSALGNSKWDWAEGVSANSVLNLSAGTIGECPVERGLVAVGPGTGDCAAGESIERIYTAYRALSIESVTVAAKRDEATMFEVSFRLLPNSGASYGKIVDRVVALGAAS